MSDALVQTFSGHVIIFKNLWPFSKLLVLLDTVSEVRWNSRNPFHRREGESRESQRMCVTVYYAHYYCYCVLRACVYDCVCEFRFVCMM